MLELIQAIPFSFAALFPVVNPIGSSVIFMSIVRGSSPQTLNRLAVKIALYVTIMLSVVLFVGSWILRIFGITIPIVMIGGGLVLAYIGWQLLNRPSTNPDANVSKQNTEQDADNMAFYPLTMPVTAGPGVIAVTMALGAHSMTQHWNTTLLSLAGNTAGIILISLTVYFCYRYTHDITQKLGEAGTQVIMRLAAFLNLCIGLELIWHGIRYLLGAPVPM